jgi:prepilin-type N-terminal cleavage/methylation domain-containing protein
MIRRLAQWIRHGEEGFTLSEMLVVLVIMSIVIAALVSVLAMSITQNTQIQEQSTLQTEVRSVVENMARELRQAYSGDTTYPILTATSTSLEFMSPDRATPFHNRHIAYRLASGQVDRAMTTSTDTDGAPWTGFGWTSYAGVPAGSWGKQVGSVTNSAIFTYFNKSGAQLTGTITPSAVYRVLITVQVATKGNATRKFTYSTSASVRSEP